MKRYVARPVGWFSVFLCVLMMMPLLSAQAEQDLRVFSRWMERSDATESLHRYLNALAFDKLAERRAVARSLKTSKDLIAR